jgi:hypothetical protein
MSLPPLPIVLPPSPSSLLAIQALLWSPLPTSKPPSLQPPASTPILPASPPQRLMSQALQKTEPLLPTKSMPHSERCLQLCRSMFDLPADKKFYAVYIIRMPTTSLIKIVWNAILEKMNILLTTIKCCSLPLRRVHEIKHMHLASLTHGLFIT